MYIDDHAATDISVPIGDEQNPTEVTIGVELDDTDGDITFVDLDAGPAGYDTDGDGRNDTAVITNPAGSLLLLSDIDGDGSPDVATEISGMGQITVSEQVEGGQWIVVERSQLDAEESSEPAATDGRADDASVGFATSGGGSAGSAVDSIVPVDSVVSIDPVTGEWTITSWQTPGR